jgi:FAD/FMN-containing dehydrogenase
VASCAPAPGIAKNNTVPSDTLRTTARLKHSVRGEVILPGDPSYDRARTVWNAMINRRPAVIVRCATTDDVPCVVSFARDRGLEISIRGGGHNIAGHAVCDGGMMMDLSGMRNVLVDAASKRAYVEPGATLHDLDTATQAYGLATPVGINSTTGVAGLTLGGGFGWLTRKLGMTVDNLASADIVTATGAVQHASEKTNPDLFWAIRGGGGNFGVVTRFEFILHPTGPDIWGGLIVFPFAQAASVLREYRDYLKFAPEELNVWVVVRHAPPLPFLPPAVHGQPVIALAVFYAGDFADGEKAIAPVRRFGTAHGEHIGATPYVQWQQVFDPLLTPGARNYWKSHNFVELSDGALDSIIEFGSRLPSPQCEIFVGLIAGAANRVAPDATAYPHRDARFVMNVHSRWESPADDEACIRWACRFFAASAPYASAGAYVNFMTADETERVTAAYGANYSRLAAIKRRYDPSNVFHVNQNITV